MKNFWPDGLMHNEKTSYDFTDFRVAVGTNYEDSRFSPRKNKKGEYVTLVNLTNKFNYENGAENFREYTKGDPDTAVTIVIPGCLDKANLEETDSLLQLNEFFTQYGYTKKDNDGHKKHIENMNEILRLLANPPKAGEVMLGVDQTESLLLMVGKAIGKSKMKKFVDSNVVKYTKPYPKHVEEINAGK